MLNEMAKYIIRGKWIVLGFNLFLSIAVAITTGVVLNLNAGGLWLPIFSAVCLAVSSVVLTIFELLGFSDWAQSCKDVASQFIKLGRKIEAMKRIQRSERHCDGVEFMNTISSK